MKFEKYSYIYFVHNVKFITFEFVRRLPIKGSRCY